MSNPDVAGSAAERWPAGSAPAARAPRGQRCCLVLPQLDELPRFPLPSGFGLRAYGPGDRRRWSRIIAAADPEGGCPAGMHRQTFGNDLPRLVARQLFLTAPGGLAIGTATAWFGTGEKGPDWGRLHWLAVIPEWQGRGLAKPLLAAALERLRELGHQRAYLITETFRHPALGLYHQFGFRAESPSGPAGDDPAG